MPERITYETSVTGYFKGFKSELKSFLKARDIGCYIQTSYLPDKSETRITHVMMEGESSILFVAKQDLDSHLKIKFPGIEIDEWIEKESTDRLTRALITPTAGCKSTTSAGYAEISQGNQSIIPEWKVIAASGYNTVVGYLRDAGYVIAASQSAVSGLSKAVFVTYKDITVAIDASYSVTWTNFGTLLKENEKLAIEKELSIEDVYFLDGSEKTFVRSIDLLKEGVRYYVEEVKKDAVIDPRMQEFYEKLKSEEDLDEDDIEIIKKAFAAQKLKFKQLVRTGEFAMTDKKLKEYGVKEGGLRDSILYAIKNLM